MDFGSEVDGLVNIVYMVLTASDKPEVHLQILAAIAQLLSRREAREDLRKAGNALEAMSAIRQHSNRPETMGGEHRGENGKRD